MTTEDQAPTRDRVLETLRSVKYPGYSRDIVSFGMVKRVEVRGGDVAVELEVNSANPEIPGRIENDVRRAVSEMPGVAGVEVSVARPAPSRSPASPGGHPMDGQRRIEGVGRVVAVASGKGGVGKSTVAVNLACALRAGGHEVGLLDCDIYGPSIPMMMGTAERPEVRDERIVPVVRHGIRLLSLGFIVDENSPVIWRGPLVNKVVRQFLEETDWRGVDYLVIDLPPGTGDAQLTLVQTIPLDGVVIVTTPQDVALVDARKGVGMFQKTGVRILGIVENMSWFVCPHCGAKTAIFGEGGGRRESARLDVPLLAEIPIEPGVRESGDQGNPVVIDRPDSEIAASFGALAGEIARVLPLGRED